MKKQSSYTLWSDTFWKELGHGHNQDEASRLANKKLDEYLAYRAKLRASDPGPPLVEDGEDSCIVLRYN